MAGSRAAAMACLLGVVLPTVSGCADDAPLSDELSQYTDEGDGCQQAVSAITYAEGALKHLGQEPYQEFNDSVRSRVASVNGTIALEVRDFPSEEALKQARRVAELADETAAAGVKHARRVELLREYRREAAQFVIVCGREVDGL